MPSLQLGSATPFCTRRFTILQFSVGLYVNSVGLIASGIPTPNNANHEEPDHCDYE